MHPDERAIRAAITDWLRASEAGDLARLARILADDVEFLTPSAPPFGKAAFLAGGPATGLTCRADVREVVVTGDWAWTRCEVDVSIQPAGDAPPKRYAGPTLTVWRREPDGRWVMARDANFVTPRG